MSSHHQLSPQIPLFCEEHYWDSSTSTTQGEDIYYNAPFLEENDVEELSSLLQKEQESLVLNYPGRVEAVEWMLKVVDYYSFSALTAVLAVNYLDRFAHTFKAHGEKEKPWMTHLAAVACISLAAKVEETHVPLLFDLQVDDSNYVFESKTIQRMEILVLSTLNWKMNPVTPLCFLDCIATKLRLFNHISRDFLRRCHCLLLSLLSDCRFMRYPPSALATATMLYVISSVEPKIVVEHHDQLIGILGINKDKVENCSSLIQEVATSGGLYEWCNKRKLPGSPKGVVDVCFSSDDSSPEHFAKRFKSK